MPKHGLGLSVFEAAQQRIAFVFDNFPQIYVSFSGGKDSSVMLHLVSAEARKRGRKVGLLVVDLEAQYALTIQHICEMCDLYQDALEVFWVALPINLRNAVSNLDPRWQAWDPDASQVWVRQPDPRSITDQRFFPFFRRGMEFEEFVPQFGHWYGQGKLCACFVGIRADESLNRYRAVTSRGTKFDGHKWTSYQSRTLFNAYPIYDWQTVDLWRFNSQGHCYNRLYDRMHQAGLSIHQMRICQPYGDDQRKGLWLYHIIEPETWARVVARVAGANSGALYAQESGNILGRIKIAKPAGHTWQSFAKMLLATMPPKTQAHYENKIVVFLKWWQDRGYSTGIPDELPVEDKKAPSWRRICKMLLRNDYWAKGLSFTQTKSDAYERYKKVMKRRQEEWKIKI